MFHLKISWRFIKEALIQPEAEVGAPDSWSWITAAVSDGLGRVAKYIRI